MDEDGTTALILAKVRGRTKTADALRELGATD
jgi:hypothetical protein